MNKRCKFSLTIGLVIMLGASPLLSLAATMQSASRQVVGTSMPRSLGNTGIPPNPLKPAVAARLRAVRLPQNAQSANGIAGQSTTLLPDGRLLKIGGLGQDELLSAATIVDPHTNEVVQAAQGLQRARAWHTATMLPDGNVLILGGIGADGQTLGSAEIFHPETQEFESLASSGFIARAYHTATLLTDGHVLIVGGLSKDGKPVRKVELWDFETKTITVSPAKLKLGRYAHTATLLGSGDVLFEGGLGESGEPLSKDEMYRAASSRFGERPTPLTRSVVEAPPCLAASLPPDGAVNVSFSRPIALRFSKPLRVETLNSATISLAGPQGMVHSRVVPAEGGMLTFITPLDTITAGATYSLILSGATDRDGTSLPNVTIRFTTAGVAIPSAGKPDEDDAWVPGAENLKNNWQTNREKSDWQSLAPMQAESGVTALAGQVLRLNGKPLENVMLEVEGRTAMTDGTGRFLLRELAPGHHELVVHGHGASTPGKSYGMFEIGVEVKQGQTNVLPFTIWMPVIDAEHPVRLAIPTREPMTARTSRMPGLEVQVPRNVILRSKSGEPLSSFTLTPIPLDRPPVPAPPGSSFYFTMQTHGARVESVDGNPKAGIRLLLPNYSGAAPGTRLEILTYHSETGWRSAGQGAISPDGKRVIPDPDFRLQDTPCLIVMGPPNYAPGTFPPAGGGTYGGDPVELSTGLFVLNNTDMVLPDIIPIVIARTYRQNDTTSRGFGIGAAHSYDIFLVGDTASFSYADLILPDGGRIHYTRTSLGTGSGDAVMEHTATPTVFYKSTLTRVGALDLWVLKLKNGTSYEFKGGVDTTQSKGPTLVGIQDRHGNRLNISRYYDSTISRITSPNGRWINFAYNGSRISQITDSAGRTVSYTYDASGRLWKVTNPKNEVTEYGYDTSHRMTTIKDARNIVYLTNEYDANGRIFKQTQADTTFFQMAYTLDGNGKVTQADLTDPKGYVRRVTFNASGYVLTDTYALGRPEQQTYTYGLQAGTNLVQSVTDQLTRRTDFNYDPMGNVTSITRMAGTSQALTMGFTYEPQFNQLATVTDPLNHTTTFGYDGNGSITSVTDALSHQATFGYNPAGQLTSVTDALTHSLQLGYEAGDPATVTDPLGNTARTFVDAVGRPVSKVNALGQSVTFEIDALNRVTKVIDPLQGQTRYGYDPNGNLLTLTDARNKVISYHYDAMDRVDTRTDPLLKHISYQYDDNGNLRQVTDRKNQVTTFGYDGLNRLTLVTYADNSTTAYTYDAGNRLRQMADSAAGTISYDYDDFDRLMSETTSRGVVSYTYDAAGRLATKSIPGQAQIIYTFDNANRLTQIQQGTSIVAFGYDNANRLTSETLPNGVVTEYGYDNSNRLTSLTYKKNGAVIGTLTYGYDAAGRRTRVGGSLARLGLPPTLSNTSYNDGNRQTGFGTAALTYDDNGNLISDGTNTYTWNVRGQLTNISGPGLSASFSYDAVGRRSSKTVNGATTSYLYDGANIAQEITSGSPSADLLTGGVDRFFSRTDSTGTATPLRDGLGSVVALTDASGAVQTSYSYDPFGKTTASGAVSGNSQKYTGREEDGTGLYYYRNRYYSPTLQRFISEDPIGLRSGDVNVYAYARNNPVMYTDPSGLEVLSQEMIEALQHPAPCLGGRQKDSDPEDPALWGAVRTPAQGGPPNGQITFPTKGGKTIRYFDASGRAIKDIDYGHDHGAGDPHVHDWDWTKNPPRQPGRAPLPGEIPYTAPPSVPRSYYPGMQPRWDDGTPVSPDQIPIMPINPYIPGFPGLPGPVWDPVFVW